MIFKTCERYNATVKILIKEEDFALALQISILKRTSVSLPYRYQPIKVLKILYFQLEYRSATLFSGIQWNGSNWTGYGLK